MNSEIDDTELIRDADEEIGIDNRSDTISEASELPLMKEKSVPLAGWLSHCGPMLFSLTLGVLIGSIFTQQRPQNIPNFEFFEQHCDDNLDTEVVAELCYSHTDTLKHSLVEKLSSDSTNFLVIGDWGRNGHCCQNDVALEMSRVEFADFILNTGDNFYETGLSSPTDSKVYTSWKNVYDKGNLLNIPWYSVLGNHDYESNTESEANIEHTSWVLSTEKAWRKTIKNALFVFVDTTPLLGAYYKKDEPVYPFLPSHDAQTQRDETMEKLKEALELTGDEQTSIKWKIVVGHHPVVTIGEHYNQDQPDRFFEDTFSTFLSDNGVNIYFSGHDHNLQHLRKKNVEYFISGAGSKIRAFPYAKTEFSSRATDKETAQCRFHHGSQGFIAASVTEEELLVQFIDLRGAWLYSTLLKVESNP